MRPIVFMAHGEIISPAKGLTMGGVLITLRKANAALACLPENIRIPRPQIVCGKDAECFHTAELLAAQYLSGYSIESALKEEATDETIARFTEQLRQGEETLIVISHMTIIGKILDHLALAKGERFPEPLRDLAPDEVAAVDLDAAPFVSSLVFAKGTTGVNPKL